MTSLINDLLSSVLGIRIVRARAIQRILDELKNMHGELQKKHRELQKLSTKFAYLPNTLSSIDRIRQIGALINPKTARGVKKIRIGGANDGGYVCLDEFQDIIAAVSLGIENNVSWDFEIAERNITVLQYDHTIPSPPCFHKNFVFYRSKISAVEGDDVESINSIITKNSLFVPASVIGKIDIEGDEWEVLLSTSDQSLQMFSQLICEFHWFDKINEERFFERMIQVFRKLNKVFEVVHVHANNYAPLLVVGNHLFPTVIEITFANRQKFTFEEANEVFPGCLDAPNNPRAADHQLGKFIF
jgi:hypothetical protein